ncbi:UDP-glucose/GDP-mannose dehydrogenase family protein [Candidatus Roizmanbacteria bacterium]|nr:UDP-glucose/GDP-mannose dehydrogenase family protein [Candidatus Roizmanbacteria bacterium]
MAGNSNKNNHKLKICIIGPGVVGQAQGKVFALHGYKTVFLGGNQEKTERLRRQGYTAFGRDELFDGTYNFDISMLTVPTPTINGRINLSALESASADLGKRLAKAKKRYHLVVVKSTVPPGTTEDLVIKTIKKYSGWKLGRDFGVCMNPEYLREATAYEDALKPWVILIGEYDKMSGDILASVYSKFECPIFRCLIKEAEMQKYIHNLFNAAKITFFNEMREIGKQVNVDVEKIFKVTALSAEGMWNPNYGIRDFGPFDGSCLPKDTQAFLEWTKNNGLDADLLEALINVNNAILRKNGLTEHAVEIGTRL